MQWSTCNWDNLFALQSCDTTGSSDMVISTMTQSVVVTFTPTPHTPLLLLIISQLAFDVWSSGLLCGWPDGLKLGTWQCSLSDTFVCKFQAWSKSCSFLNVLMYTAHYTLCDYALFKFTTDTETETSNIYVSTTRIKFNGHRHTAYIYYSRTFLTTGQFTATAPLWLPESNKCHVTNKQHQWDGEHQKLLRMITTNRYSTMLQVSETKK